MGLQKLREKMFDDYSSNLTALGKYVLKCRDAKGIFVCPICRNEFGRDVIDSLTVEHCIPRSLGGTLATATLLCARCNNTSGTLYDAHYQKLFSTEAFFQGNTDNTMPCRVNVEGKILRGVWKFRFDGKPHVEFYIDDKSTHPDDLPRAKARMEEMLAHPDDSSITFSFRMPFVEWRARVALLRMAYLMMFRQFGYSYVLHPCAEKILNQILSPDKKLLPDAFSATIVDHEMPNSVFLITSPLDRKAFLVLLKFKNANRHVIQAIVLPGPSDTEGEVYKRCSAEKQSQDRFAGKMKWVPHNTEWIRRPWFVDLLGWAWDEDKLQEFTTLVTQPKQG